MLNKIWPIFIIISIIYGVLTGNIEKLNNSIFESTDNAVKLVITLFGTICFWNGIMQIAMKSSLVETITKILNPIIKIIFPEVKKGEKIHKEISMNMVANILGLGNAAAPLGLKASIQIIPTTVMAIRNSLGSEEPSSIIFAVWVATICAAISAVIVGKLIIKLGK